MKKIIFVLTLVLLASCKQKTFRYVIFFKDGRVKPGKSNIEPIIINGCYDGYCDIETIRLFEY